MFGYNESIKKELQSMISAQKNPADFADYRRFN